MHRSKVGVIDAALVSLVKSATRLFCIFLVAHSWQIREGRLRDCHGEWTNLGQQLWRLPDTMSLAFLTVRSLAQNFGVFLLESEHPRLTNRQIIFEDSQPMWSQYLNVQTDAEKTCRSNTALCVSSRVKINLSTCSPFVQPQTNYSCVTQVV